MKYAEGKIGRIFSLRLDEGEELKKVLMDFSREKNIKSAILFLLGASKEIKMVSMKPEGNPPFRELNIPYNKPLETLGVGDISWKGDEVIVHVHLSGGEEGGKSFTGCLRDKYDVTYFTEVFIIEVNGVFFNRVYDDELKVNKLEFGNI